MASPAAILSVLVRADTGKASAALLRFNAHLGETEKKSNKASAALKTLGKGAVIGTGAGLAYAVKKAADFEQQLDSLASVSGATRKEMERLRREAMKAGADTKFSALEAAKAQTELAKGGLKVSQISRGGLRSALALAAAGELELADAAETTANALNLFGLRGKQSMKVADALATAANATTADVEDFAMALKMGGSVAKTAGLSFSQTVLALEALAKVGIRNSDAGTSLKTALIQLAAPTKKQHELAQALNLDWFDAQGNMKKLADVSAMLQKRTGDMTREQRLATFATLAGTDGVRTLSALYEAGPQKLKRWEKGLNKSGTAAKVAAEKQDNLKGKLENLQGSIETLAISIGTSLIPPLTDAAEKLTAFINQMQTGQGVGGKFADKLKGIAGVLKDLVKFAVDHPVTTSLLAALGVIAKAKGGPSGLKKVGGIGGIIGGAKPIPVFVTNPGFGGKGGGLPPVIGGSGEKAGTMGKVGKALRWVPIVGSRGNVVALALTALAIGAENHVLPDNNVGRAEGRRRQTQTPSGRGANIPGSEGADARQKARLQASQQQYANWSKHTQENIERVNRIQDKFRANSRQNFQAAGDRLADLRSRTAKETERIRERFKTNTDKGRQALADNYQRAAAAAKRQMDRAGFVTEKGLRFIREMFVQEMALYGVPRSQALAIEKQNRSSTDNHMPLRGDMPGSRRQRGGRLAMGGMPVPGVGSGDKVHMQAMVEPGEQVFVLNRNASAALSGLQRLNQMVPRFASGGLMPGISNLVKTVQSHWPGLNVSSGLRPGDTGSFHSRGMAADLASTNYTYMNQAAAWIRKRFGRSLTEGIHNPNLSIDSGHTVPASFWGSSTWAQHANHIHLAVTGAVQRMAKLLKAPQIRGSGPMRDILQAAMGRATKAANRRMGQLSMTTGDSAFSGNLGGFGKNRLMNLWTRAGGDPSISNLMAAIALAESGGNPSAHNPSGASGLWQILGQIVPGNVFNPLVNARNAVAKYRSQGLGAWEAYTNGNYRQYLKKGGLARLQGGGGTFSNYSFTGPRHFGLNALQRSVRKKGRKQARRQKATAHNRQVTRLENLFSDKSGEFGAAAALAALTATSADDIAAARTEASFWAEFLPIAQGLADSGLITTAATGLSSARSLLEQLTAPVPAAVGEIDVGSLQEMLRLANLRTAVSQAQYPVFSGGMPAAVLPFQSGGAVPVVNSNITVADGMGWLKQFIHQEIRQSQRRVTNRDPLPGRGGGITRLG